MSDRNPGLMAVLAAVLVLAPGGSVAQEAPAADVFETVEVNVVNVDVYVTDKKGHPVTGLTAADFELYEDGKRVGISNFYSASERVGEIPMGAPVVAAPGGAPRPPQRRTPKDQRLKMVIFVDNMNLRPVSRNRVLDALQGSMFFQLSPDDEVMLASYNGGGLEIHHPLSRDPDSLAAEIERLAEVNPRGAHKQLDRIAILRDLQQADLEEDADTVRGLSAEGTVDWEGMFMEIQNYAQERYQESVRTIEILAEFVDSLSGLDGRKALIYVSDGLSLRPGEALYHAWDRKRSSDNARGQFVNVESQARETDITPLLEELGKRANANRVTFYTVLASGGQSQTMTAAERGAFVNVGSAPASTLGQAWSDQLDAMETSNFRGGMRIMAEATGGVATLNTTAITSALRRLRGDFDSYYSLGYVSPSEADGKDHTIQVKTRDPSLRVRHREGYRAKTGDQRMSDLVKSAMLFDDVANPLQVQIDFGEEKKDDQGRFLVPIMVRFPLANLLLLPQEQFHEGRVSIFVGARDSKGGTSPIQKMPAPIRIPNDKLLTALGQIAGFRATLLMRDGEHAVAVGVRDELANLESTTRVAHTPGQARAPGENVAAAPGTR